MRAPSRALLGCQVSDVISTSSSPTPVKLHERNRCANRNIMYYLVETKLKVPSEQASNTCFRSAVALIFAGASGFELSGHSTSLTFHFSHIWSYFAYATLAMRSLVTSSEGMGSVECPRARGIRRTQGVLNMLADDSRREIPAAPYPRPAHGCRSVSAVHSTRELADLPPVEAVRLYASKRRINVSSGMAKCFWIEASPFASRQKFLRSSLHRRARPRCR